jgi:hypothetical protein
VPVIYVASAQARALKYRESLQAAHAWFEAQTGSRLPFVFAVLDQHTYAKIERLGWPMAYAAPGVLVFASRIEDIVGPEPNARAPGEYITFHEDGHNFAHLLKIGSGNASVNELVANTFMAAYINNARQDLKWVLDGPSSSRFKETPRYTSLADLDYLSAGVGIQNYIWFQYELQRIASFLVTGQSFPTVVRSLQAEFPSTAEGQETLDRIIAHLDHIRPGVRGILGPLAGPTTLPRLRPSACTKAAALANTQPIPIAIRNDSGHQVAVVTPDGESRTIPAGAWDGFEVKSGDSLKLPGGTCLVAGQEPALAVVAN